MLFDFGKNEINKKADHLDNVRIMIDNQFEYEKEKYDRYPEDERQLGVVIGLNMAKKFLDLGKF